MRTFTPARAGLLALVALGLGSILGLATTTAGAPPRVLQARFAVIGDYGTTSLATQDVAARVRSWNPDFILTTGDNNYPSGAAATIDANIGQHYQMFISPYTGSYGQGAPTNKFWPTLGNHDWEVAGAEPYHDYFTLPNNERYYDFASGPVRLFALDTDSREPDGISSTGVQAQWLQGRLAATTERWKLVYGHHPPYSSGSSHGSSATLQWPYAQWGATAVLSGHEHNYERILRNGIVYLVNGLGGRSLYGFGTPVSGSALRYSQDYGALLVTATDTSLNFQFISRGGQIVDNYTLQASGTQSLVGTAIWQGRPAPPHAANQLPITLTLKLGAAVTQYPDLMTDARGVFTVPVSTLSPGTYTWWAKGPRYLATTGTVTLGGAAVVQRELGQQRAGDANNSNVVDSPDFALLRTTFGRRCGDAGYDGRADFTGDCLVDVSDFTLLRANFGQAGAPPP